MAEMVSAAEITAEKNDPFRASDAHFGRLAGSTTDNGVKGKSSLYERLEAGSMSLKIMSAVWDDPGIETVTEFSIMITLADFANDAGQCWPSLPTICRKSRCCRGTVYNTIQRMVKNGKLSYVKGRQHRANHYQFHLSAVHPVNCSVVQPVNGCEIQQFTTCTPAVHPVNPNRKEPSITPLRGVGGLKAAPPRKNTPDDKRFWIVSKQLENAKGKFRSALLKEQAVLTSRITGIAQPASVTPTLPQPSVLAPPADPAKAQALLNDLKASVAAAVPIRPLPKVMKQVRFKRPLKTTTA